jgi:hypothetical protein
VKNLKLHIVFIGLLLLAGFSFAQGVGEACAESCCDEYNGDYRYGSCSGLSMSESVEYSDCVKTCTEVASCCAPAFLMVGLVGAAFVVRN